MYRVRMLSKRMNNLIVILRMISSSATSKSFHRSLFNEELTRESALALPFIREGFIE
jgi:hypothetical protein